MRSDDLWPLVLSRMREYIGQSWDIEGLSRAIGVSPGTIGEWLSTRRPANGERLIRLWHYLAAVGINSPELQALPAHNYYAGQLLAMSLVTMEELQTFFNVHNASTALQILRGQQPMRPLVSLQDLRKRHDRALEAKLASLPKFIEANTGGEQPPAPSKMQPTASTSLPDAPSFMLDAAVHLSAALPICRHLNSDACTPQERSRFRDLMGSETLFDLSNTTGALCSERARRNSR